MILFEVIYRWAIHHQKFIHNNNYFIIIIHYQCILWSEMCLCIKYFQFHGFCTVILCFLIPRGVLASMCALQLLTQYRDVETASNLLIMGASIATT